MIEVSGVVTRAHYAEFSGVAYKRVNRVMSFWGRWAGLLVIILTASFLGLVSGMNNTPQTGGMSESGFTSVLVGLCAGILATALANIIYQTGFLAKFILDDGFVLGPRTFKFADDGMTVIARNGETRVQWNGLLGVSTHESMVAVWYDPGIAFIIPRDAIGDPAAVQELVDFVEARIDAANNVGANEAH